MPAPERRTLIVGAAGQDGQLLFRERERTSAVIGLDRDALRTHGFGGDLTRDFTTVPDVLDPVAMVGLVERCEPEELYYLAAHHHSAEERPEDGDELHACMQVNFHAFVNVLEAVRQRAPACRVFYASSSQVFGTPETTPQDETTRLAPENPYAVSKVAGMHAAALYRRNHGLHVSVGILYNHESSLRPARFVSQRIVRGAQRAARDPGFKLRLGSLTAVVDWGYALDYVDAMTRIVAQTTPGDYIVASGVPHTVEDFVSLAFAGLGLDWRAHVVVDETRVTQAPARGALVGDATKLRTETGWTPSLTFDDLVHTLLSAAVPAPG